MCKVQRTIETLKTKLLEGWALSCGLSGKDSFCVAHCAIEALKQAQEINPNAGGVHLVTTDTTHDNYELVDFLERVHKAADEYALDFNLNVKTHFIRPTITNTPIVQYLGRGKLLRTPKTSTNGRDCAIDFKIIPMENFLRELKNEYQSDKILAISGTRDEESVVRAANIAKRGESIDVVAMTDLGYTLAPIKDWSLTDVWSLASKIDNGEVESFGEDVADELRRHYAAGNGGSCDLFAGNSFKKQSSCGARFGCWSCSMISNDDSLQAQIDVSPNTYGYMSELPKFRTFMSNTLFDMERSRSMVGREVKDGRWVKIGYNQYSLEYRKELLRYALTIDYKEATRAEIVGEEPKFTLVSYEALIAIQFYWSRQGGEKLFGDAIRIWHDVHTEGNLYEIPETSPIEEYKLNSQKHLQYIGGSSVQDEYRYLDFYSLLGANSKVEMPGLGLFTYDTFKPHMHRVKMDDGSYEPIIPIETASRFTIEPIAAENYVEDTFLDYLDEFSGPRSILSDEPRIDGTVVLKDLLYRGIVKVRNGEIKRIHIEAKRAQMMNAIGRAGKYFDTVAVCYSISLSEYENIKTKESKVDNSGQGSLFELVA